MNFDLTVNRDHRELIQGLALINSLSRTIRDIPIPLSLQERLHTLNIVRAVRGTTGIEGTELTEEEVSDVLNSDSDARVLSANRIREEREVRNSNELMRFVEHVLRSDPGLPLTDRLIRRFHEILTTGINYEHNEPGRYRQQDVHVARYQPPRHVEVPELMEEFIKWLNDARGRSLDPVVRAVVAHFLLVSIHPFGDGNGRTSRGVESFLLYKAGVNVRGFYSLANYYYQHRGEYVRLLDHVRFDSDPDITPFVLFAVKGLTKELEQVHSECLSQLTIVSFKEYAREKMSARGRLVSMTGQRQFMFLLELDEQRVPLDALLSGSHPLARFYSNVGYRTVYRDVDQLEEMDLIVIEEGIIRAKTEVMSQYTSQQPGSHITLEVPAEGTDRQPPLL